MKTVSLLLMAMAMGVYGRVLEDAPAPAPTVSSGPYAFVSDMIFQEGGVDAAALFSDGGDPCTWGPSITSGTIHKRSPLERILRFFRGRSSNPTRVVTYFPTSTPVTNVVTGDDVYVKYDIPGSVPVYKNVPEKINDLQEGQQVDVEFLPPCQEQLEYKLYRIIITE